MSGTSPYGFELLTGWYSARALVAAEWAPAIVMALVDGPMNYSQLRDAVEACHVAEGWNPRHERLHQSTLTRSLRQLAGDGLLVREEAPGVFPRSVRYSLAPAALEFVEAMTALAAWVARHRDLVEAARRRRWESDHEEPDDPVDGFYEDDDL